MLRLKPGKDNQTKAGKGKMIGDVFAGRTLAEIQADASD
jgi:hypothetical protein